MRQVLFAGLLIIGLVATASPSFARTRVRAPAVVAGIKYRIGTACLVGERGAGMVLANSRPMSSVCRPHTVQAQVVA